MARYCAKLWLLVWKNWKVQVNQPCDTFSKISLPLLFIIILFFLRLSINVKHHRDVTRYPAYDPADPLAGRAADSADLGNASSTSRASWELAWSPQEAAPATFANDSQTVMQIASGGIFTLRQFSSPAELESYMYESARLRPDSPGNGTMTLAGVVLADEADPAAPKVCSRRLKVTLRFPSELRMSGAERERKHWMTNSIFPEFQTSGPRDNDMATGPLPGYTREGFTALQALVSRAVAQRCTTPTPRSGPLQPLTGKAPRRRGQPSQPSPFPDVRLRRFSYPPFDQDPLADLLPNLLFFCLCIALLPSLLYIVQSIVEEKARQIKETLKIMGVPTSLHWIAWFIHSMIMQLIIIVLIVVFLKYPTKNGAILNHSSPFVLITFLALCAASFTFFAFMISVFFSNALFAFLFANAINLLLLPLFFTLINADFSLTTILLMCLIYIGGLGVGVNIIMKYEGIGVGLQWSNIWSHPSPDYPMAMGTIWLLILLNCLIHILITLYVEAVYPGKYGVPKPWNFLCEKSFWRPQQPEEGAAHPRAHVADPRNFEEEPSGARAGVRLSAVSKVFPGNKMAVNNLNLNMYEGQITVLLGHNGAGKTTTISMMTGMTTPTSGSVAIGGHDLRSHTDKARERMGFCMQHNVLFDQLTVREHLYFFCKLKGLTGDELKEEINVFLKLMRMEEEKNKKSTTLSGGMKRKLAVCMALCGKSKVVFLDEPTSGMDPAARRALWDLLREMKTGRTLLLTTHMMDEADVLGDRIAIMAGGRLQCYGSPFFLKKRFSGGYHLVVVKGRRCSTSNVSKLLAKHIQGLKIVRETGFEIVYQLDEARTASFGPMLADLERKASELDVSTFGVSLTTMEEVFLKVCEEYETVEKTAEPQTRSTRLANGAWPEQRLTGLKLLCNQVRAMCLKKGLVAQRGWLALLLFLLFPTLYLLFVYFVSDFATGVHMLPALSMGLESYKNSKTVIAVGTGNKSLATMYKDLAADGDIIVLENQTSPSDAYEHHMLNQYNADMGKTRQYYIIGASFEEDQITGWFNDQPHHAVPLALNMLYNAHLKSSDISLNIVNHPLPFSEKSQTSRLRNDSTGVTMAIGFGLILLSSYFILFPIRERSNKSKHLQIVSGVNVLIFWGVHFIFDFFCFLAAFVLIIVVLACIHLNCLSTGEELARILAVLVCFASANLAFIYLVSFMFTSEPNGLLGLMTINVIGYVASATINKFIMMEAVSADTLHILQWIFFTIPMYTLMEALNNLQQYCSYSDLCSKFKQNCSQVEESFCCPEKCPITGCVSTPPNYFQWTLPGVGKHMFVFFLWGFIFFIILLIIDSYWLNDCFMCLERCCVRMVLLFKKGQDENLEEDEDEDVLNEKEKISLSNETQLKEYSVVLRGVTKYYCALRAVNNISVGVEKGEIFGLLGANGAGKTSTFKIMTGDVRMTKGKGYLMSYNIQKEPRKVHKNVGYCPQFDALIEVMTVRETLKMYLLLRGYSSHKVIPRETKRIAKNMDLMEHIDKKVKDCSGGNKRKLSLAVALLGEPPLVFLDEPTTGMDPSVRRQVWDVVMELRESGNSVILTTHSMEECEVLCTRLAIMVNGTFKCLGPIQQLKNKFAEGYILIIKVKEEHDVPQRIIRVKDFINTTFSGAVLKLEYLRLLTYNIPRKIYPWSQMFDIMEKAKTKLDIEDYSLGQTSLEQVFLHLTSLQRLQK